MRSRLAVLAVALAGGAHAQQAVTFEEAVKRAVESHPSIGEATQAILRAQALLDQARTVFRPALTGNAATVVLDDARGFAGNITVPRRQSIFHATVSYPFLAAERWAIRSQAKDQVGIARISAEETRRQVALNAASSYLAVIAARRQLDIALRNRDTARALADYSRIRLEAGQGSKLNFVRSSQELSTGEGLVQVMELAVRQAQEALGVAIFAGGPVDARVEPELAAVPPPADEQAWLLQRPDVRLVSAQVGAADRVVHDAWKSWLPTGTAAFTPQYVTPAGFFEPGKTWRAVFQLQLPIYDGTLSAEKRVNQAELESLKHRLEAVKDQARSEVRAAQEAVVRNEQVVANARQASELAAEALRITEIAYRAGATTNIEVVQAQQAARNVEIASAVAEDRLRQARLDLLVALGRFP